MPTSSVVLAGFSLFEYVGANLRIAIVEYRQLVAIKVFRARSL